MVASRKAAAATGFSPPMSTIPINRYPAHRLSHLFDDQRAFDARLF